MPVTVRQVLKALHSDGWYIDRIAGSHRQLRHATKSGTVTVPGRLSADLHPKTLQSILAQSGLNREDVK